MIGVYDIYLCKAQVKSYFKLIRKPYFSGYSEPFNVVEPNPTITEIREQEKTKIRLAESRLKMLQLFVDSMNEKKGL